MKKKMALLALPVIAIFAIAGIVSAHQPWNNGNIMNIVNMTQEDKDYRVQELELRQEMLQSEIAYLKGEITQNQFNEQMQQIRDEMMPLHEQMMQSRGELGSCDGGFGMKRGFGRGMGREMIWRDAQASSLHDSQNV